MANEPETPIAVAVVRQSGQVLIGKRPPDVPLGGFWEFPGGKVHEGEAPAAAAVRECREETGLEICVEGPCDEVVFPYQHGKLRIYFFPARPAGAPAVPRAPFCWVPLSELAGYRFPPANQSVLRRLLEGDWKEPAG
jgi:8-oxo-dGTP diphosphatase